MKRNRKRTNRQIFIAVILAVLLVAVMPVTAMAEQMTVTEETPVTVESGEETSVTTEDTSNDTGEEAAEDGTAADTDTESTDVPEVEVRESVADPIEIDTSAIDVSVFDSATCVMLFDAVSGEVLYEKNSDTQVYPASTTKLMSVMLAIEDNIQDRDVTVQVCADDFSEDNSLMGLIRGETIPGLDLLYGMMLKSGNDAASSVALDIAGSISDFADLMNAKAAELGMTETHFMNPSGVQDEQHYTTGNDMKKLAMYAYGNELFMQLAGTKEYIVSPTDMCSTERVMHNTNRLLVMADSENAVDYTYEYCTGMKTGYTYTANGCLVASAEKDGQAYIVLIYNDTSELGVNRWNMATTLFDFAFNNYARIKPADYTEKYTVTQQVKNIAENDPDHGNITFTADTRSFDESYVTVTKEEAEALENGTLQITAEPSFSTILAAPLEEGEEVGSVKYYLNDRQVGEAPIITTRRIYAEGEEDLQSATISEDQAEYWKNTDLATEISKNKSVLWWLLIPAGIIAFIVIRAVLAHKYKSRYRRDMYRTRSSKRRSRGFSSRSGIRRNRRY